MSFSGVLRTIRSSQSGNVFFALFGAVALVGVVGATSMQVMRGPVRSMSEVTKRTVAENNMIASSKLALLAATTQANDGDCDADTFVEPIPFEDAGASPKPTGGGYLPATIGAAINDPWDTRYGYCVWNSGALTSGNGCAANFLTGSADQTGYAIAIISAGPDRTFNTTCSAYPTATALNKTPGSDDVVLGYTYAEAEANSGGLWNLKDADTAKIAKNLEVTNNAGDQVAFALDAETGMGDFIGLTTGGITAKGTNPLSITGGLKLDDDFVETGACTAAENDAFAFDTTGDKLIRCNGANWVAAGGSDNLGNHIATQNVQLGSYWLSGDGGNEGVQVAADGAISTSGALTTGSTLAVGTNATVGGTLGVTGATTLSTVNTSGLGTLNSLSVTNAAAVGGTLNVTGGTSLTSLATSGVATLNSLAVTNAATIGTTLGVTGATTLSTVNTSGLGTLNSLAVTNNASIGGELDLTGGKIVNLLDPTAAQDAASKAYVDARVAAGTGFVEADPQVATLNATKWCVANAGGTAIECTENTPAGAADNLGNHTATTNIQLGANYLSGDGGSEGVTVSADGRVGVGGVAGGTQRFIVRTNADLTASESIVFASPTGGFLTFAPDAPASGWNSLTQSGDAVMIFADSTVGTGNLVLGNWGGGGMRMTNAGNIGIAEGNPADKLHVAGQIRIDNDNNTTNKGCIRFDGGTNKLQYSHDCSSFSDMGGAAADNLGNHIATTTLRSDTHNTDDLGTTAIRWKEGWFSHNLNARALLLEGGFIQLNSDGDVDVGLITEAGLDGIGLVGNATRIATPDLYVTDAGDVGIGDNTPSSKLQVNGTVTATAFAGSGASLTGIVSAGITDGTITAADIAAGAVGSSEVTDNSLTAADLAADSVGASELAANAVASANIIDGSITAADLAAGVGGVTARTTASCGGTGTSSCIVACPAGYFRSGCSGYTTAASSTWARPSSTNSCECAATNSLVIYTCYAYCVQ